MAPSSSSLREFSPNLNRATATNDEKDEILGAAGFDVSSCIRQVQEFWPHLKEDFIREQLKIYDGNSDRLINAILDGNVVQSEVKQEDKQYINGTDNIRDRANIFDGDEFDIFARNDIDVNKIHQGKKDHSISLKDQEASRAAKTRVAMYEADAGDPIENEYDDEYDDTYDTHDVGVQDNNSESEYEKVKPFVTPRIFCPYEVCYFIFWQSCLLHIHKFSFQKPKKMYKESDEETEEDASKRTLNFCEDPAKKRERDAQRRASQMVCWFMICFLKLTFFLHY